MPNKNVTQTISNENQVAVVEHKVSPLQPESNQWPKYLVAIEKDWKPYLGGKQGFDRAVNSLIRDL